VEKEEHFFITGGQGFIGSWIVKQLAAERASFVLFDLAADDHILQQVLEPADLGRLRRLHGDVADSETVLDAVQASRASVVIHLAGLQVPACRQDPVLGARVNVLGTLNVLEAARRLRPQVKLVVYASSAAVAGMPEDYAAGIPDDAHHVPRTHYGIFKAANEGNARVYWLDHGVPSVGLRPLSVYGVGREIGITSGPTKAIKAAVLGRPYTISFSGMTGFELAADAASIFAACARAEVSAALALNLRGVTASVEDFIRAIETVLPEAKGTLSCRGPALPVACNFLEAGLEALLGPIRRQPLVEGVRRTVEHFRRLEARGMLHVQDLEG
jgi:nucleoside-diphosphate-sugar epimerase